MLADYAGLEPRARLRAASARYDAISPLLRRLISRKMRWLMAEPATSRWLRRAQMASPRFRFHHSAIGEAAQAAPPMPEVPIRLTVLRLRLIASYVVD